MRTPNFKMSIGECIRCIEARCGAGRCHIAAATAVAMLPSDCVLCAAGAVSAILAGEALP